MAEPGAQVAADKPTNSPVVAVLAGSTGQVGSHILTTLLHHPHIAQTFAYSRRALPHTSTKLTTLQTTDTSTWATTFPTSSAAGGPPTIFFSGLGTTRAQAGGLAQQRAIDVDLNLGLARAARAADVRVYVLISSAGASAGSVFPYAAMKGELEDAVAALGFRHAVILRPGMIVADRAEKRVLEGALGWVARGMGKVSGGVLSDFWSQDARVIARAAVKAGLECLEGKRKEEGVWVVGQSDIVRLGRTEWKEEDEAGVKASDGAASSS